MTENTKGNIPVLIQIGAVMPIIMWLQLMVMSKRVRVEDPALGDYNAGNAARE